MKIKGTKEQRRIAAKIADACMLAVNGGWKIAPAGAIGGPDCMCPLGAIGLEFVLLGGLPHTRLFGSKYPWESDIFGENNRWFNAFVRAFDGGSRSGGTGYFAELGRAYREWSKLKYGWAE